MVSFTAIVGVLLTGANALSLHPTVDNIPRSNAISKPSAGCGKDPLLTSGVQTMTVDNKIRQYTLRVPLGYDSNKPYKLIFAFHGYTSSMTEVATGLWKTNISETITERWAYFGLQDKAEESAIFIAPQGLVNDPLGAGWKNVGGEDIKFVDQMIATVGDGLCVDESKRFSTGYSYGGGMTYALSCARGDQFAAVAAYSGALLSGCENGTTPVPYLGIHGISDPVLPIEQGKALRDDFVKKNGCQNTTAPEPAPGSLTHIITDYEGCKSGFPVRWIAFDGGHEQIPVDGGPNDSTKTWTPAEVWRFLNQFS
ncbi:hypothetical protein HYFRA_00003202 [Hymenoscyphus fraxineus]|uniref:Feruloyl esterase C n=1 Tax=Hymenoscyphus fraxineus TaxID=746836 RepID=A0A9N9KVR6_9HELO|nr:hypothetical protein HYFRA_00003202 [Hymenoscyphus fraxineus]